MNTPRLVRKWNEAKGNYAEMAEALDEEIDYPAVSTSASPSAKHASPGKSPVCWASRSSFFR
jgi:hypothetical protein